MFMSTNTTVRARIDEEIKKEATIVLSEIGLIPIAIINAVA